MHKPYNKSSSTDSIGNAKRPKHYITSQIKDGVFEKTMLVVRLKLNKFNAISSQFIHFKPIEFFSNFLANYLFNPYQLIGSGVLIIIGSLFILLVGHNNIYVPSSLIIILWISGSLIGTVIQLSIKFINKRIS